MKNPQMPRITDSRLTLIVTVIFLIVGSAAHAVERSGAQAQSRNRAAAALPPVGTYKIDPDHSFAFFGARHHIVGLVRGRFDKVNGVIIVSENPAESSVDVRIDAGSISTQNQERDDDLRSPAYFDVKRFPVMTYRGIGIRKIGPNLWVMNGDLTIHGITRVVPLTFTFNGLFSDTKPGEHPRAAFHALAKTKRATFALGARDNLGELGSLSTPDVDIEIDVEAQ